MASGLTELGKALGESADFEWRGKVYKVAPVSFDIEAQFSAALQRLAAEGLRRNAAYLGAQAYRDALQVFQDDLAAGEFDWSGRVAIKARLSPSGSRELVWLCLTRDGDQELTRADLEQLLRDGAKWDELMRLMQELQAPPPNGSRPAGR